jgi:predicted dehydrogenase
MMKSEHRRTLLKWAAGTFAVPSFGSLSGVAGEAPKSRPRIKVGQIGVGHAHASKLSVYRQSDDYEVVGIVEPDARLRERAKSQPAYRDLPWMTREQLLNVQGLQAVLVETRVNDLLETAEVCVEAGKHVHLDKPAGASLPPYRRILESASRKNLWVQMGYMYRYNPAVMLLRGILKQGWLGEVFEVHTVMSKVVAPTERKALAKYRGGIMFELGCHVIDLVVGVLGEPKRVVPYTRHSSQLGDALNDNMLAIFEYPNALASVKSSALEVDGFERRHLTVCGSEGTFHIQPLDNPSARVTFSTKHGSHRKGYQDATFPKFARYVGDAADMAQVIRGEKSIDYTPKHDMAVQAAVLLASGMPLDQ